MSSIEIDFEIFKKLTNIRESEEDTYNNVILRLINFYEKGYCDSEGTQNEDDKLGDINMPQYSNNDWVVKNVSFPYGTEFRGEHEGTWYFAIVKSGALYHDGVRYDSPSAAASKIRGYSENGWRFWQCKLPNQTKWKPISFYRYK